MLQSSTARWRLLLMFGNYLSSENETSNYACRQTLNMYDKVCTNRLLSVAVCTWQFPPPYAAAVVKLKKKKKSKVNLELWKSWHNTVLAFIYIRQAILLILLSFITFRFSFSFFFCTSYYPSRMSTLFIKTLDVWMLTNDPDALWQI